MYAPEERRPVLGVQQRQHHVGEGLVGAGGDHDVVLRGRQAGRLVAGQWLSSADSIFGSRSTSQHSTAQNSQPGSQPAQPRVA